MKKLLVLMSVLALVLALGLLTGCGSKSESETAGEAAGQSMDNTSGQAAGGAEVAYHDCDGGCGMTHVPMDQLTEIDGKYYCAGCAAKVKAAAEEEGGDHSHDGGH